MEQYNIADELQYAMIVKYKPQLATTSKEVNRSSLIPCMCFFFFWLIHAIILLYSSCAER